MRKLLRGEFVPCLVFNVSMRLVLIISSLGIGGAERVLVTLAGAWVRQGHAVRIITFQAKPAELPFPIDDAVQVEFLNCAVSFRRPLAAFVKLPLLLSKLRKAMLASHAERAISFMDQTNLITIIALAGTGIHLTVAERCDPLRSSLMDLPLPRLVLRAVHRIREKLYSRATRVVIQTDRARERFASPLRERAVVIPNPVSTPKTVLSDYTKPVVVALGRLVRQKRFDVLISAFATLKDEFPDWQLIVFGNGPQRQALQKQIDDANVGDRILLPGAVKDPSEAFNHGSIFVLSSESEGFPGALCEAMAHGLPAISTDCEFGPAEIVTDEMDGILVPINDPQLLAHALTRLIKSPELRLALGANAKRISARLDLDTIAKLWIEDKAAS